MGADELVADGSHCPADAAVAITRLHGQTAWEVSAFRKVTGCHPHIARPHFCQIRRPGRHELARPEDASLLRQRAVPISLRMS